MWEGTEGEGGKWEGIEGEGGKWEDEKWEGIEGEGGMWEDEKWEGGHHQGLFHPLLALQNLVPPECSVPFATADLAEPVEAA